MKHILTFAALVFATSCFGQEACPNVHDINSNGTIDIEDFLSILGLFADVDVDEDGVWDSEDACIDLGACNYDAIPSEPCAFIDVLGECGGGCEGDGDGDGICDDVDTCVGELDECGVCNGPGPTEVVIEDITILYDSVYAEQIDEWFVFEVGADTSFSITCTPTCGQPVSYQGYDYNTVLIGDQCWFAENCRYLPHVSPPGEESASEPLCYVRGYEGTDVSAAMEMEAYETYGALYNWPAAVTENICPSGWHVPTRWEFWDLINLLGGEEHAGFALKSTSGWNDFMGNSGNGSNASGFNALPGGAKSGGSFSPLGNEAFFWSTYEGDPYYYYQESSGMRLWQINHGACDCFTVQYYGLPVRCIQDSE